MAGFERRVDLAEQRTRRAVTDLGREVRLARLNHDLSQRVAAGAAGMSQATWSRMERGATMGLPVLDLARAAATVGLDLSLRVYPGGSPLRDRAHVDLLERFRRQLGSRVHWATEVPLPNAGDRRSWDGVARVATIRIGVEAETRARDSQELERRLNGKRRDGGVEHVILLLADTRHNRAFLHMVGEGFRSSFPLGSRTILRRLGESVDPGGSGIVLL